MQPMLAFVKLSISALFLSVVAFSGAKGGEISATKLSLFQEADQTRLSIRFLGEPQVQFRLLADPYRLVLDLPETIFAFDNKDVPENALVASMRSGKMQDNRSRMIFSLNKPVILAGYETRADVNGTHHDLNIVLKPGSDADFRKAVADQLLSTASTAGGKSDRVVPQSDNKGFVIVIDPGHGGIDGGATGANGTIEKEITLSFAREMAEILRQDASLKVFLTRDDDRFVPLGERISHARQVNGELFISIHADSIRNPLLRGATVYTLSDEASDEMAQAVAQNENLADAIGGVDVDVNDHAVADILIDLTRRETTRYSVGFARQVVETIKNKTHMIGNPHRHAGFKVLKAPDVPSVLVELGYLSNIEDEKQISDSAWRKMIAGKLAEAIKSQAAIALAERQ